MASHRFEFQLPSPSDHLIARGRQVLFGCGLPQDSRANEQVYRIGERQRRLLRVSLVAQFDAKRGSQQASVPVAADWMEGRFTSEVGGTLQPIGGTARDVAHVSVLSEGIDHGDSQPFGFGLAVGDASQHGQRVQDYGQQLGGVVALRRGDVKAAHAFGVAWVFHSFVSIKFRHGHFRSQVRK